MSVNGYRWNSIPLLVLDPPPPALIPLSRWVVGRPPGGRGISARVPDGEDATVFACSLLAKTHAQKTTLQAAFARHVEGPLEIPRFDGSGDCDVYEGAYVEGSVRWERVRGTEMWTCHVEFVCPDPLPASKLTGEPVY